MIKLESEWNFNDIIEKATEELIKHWWDIGETYENIFIDLENNQKALAKKLKAEMFKVDPKDPNNTAKSNF